MTLWASRDGQAVTIHGNLGLGLTVQDSRVTQYTIAEDAAMVRRLWGSLGRLLDEIESEQVTA